MGVEVQVGMVVRAEVEVGMKVEVGVVVGEVMLVLLGRRLR